MSKYRTVMRMAAGFWVSLLFIAASLLSGSTVLAAGALWTSPSMTSLRLGTSDLAILPVTPSVADTLTAEVQGQWGNTCVPEFQQLTVQGQIVTILARAEPMDRACAQVATPWKFQVQFQLDMPGEYMVSVVIFREERGITEYYANGMVVVSGGLRWMTAPLLAQAPLPAAISGIHANGCVPTYVNQQQVENRIIVELATSAEAQTCSQSTTVWEELVQISALPIGRYQVEIYVTNHQLPGHPRTRLYDPVIFQLMPGPYQFFLPVLRRMT